MSNKDTGGQITFTGGSSGSTGTGGNVTITAGNSTGPISTGGNVTITAGPIIIIIDEKHHKAPKELVCNCESRALLERGCICGAMKAELAKKKPN